MNKEIATMLQKQAIWQRNRCHLTWSEKLRMALTLRRVYQSLHNKPKRAKTNNYNGLKN